jgi:hypothetical protein
MFIKKFKKKCGVRGCKNISDVFILSRRREMGNSVAMCRQCMVDALKATDGYLEVEKAKAVPRPLFPHPELKETTISSVTEEPQPTEVIENVTEDSNISVTEDAVAIPVKEEPKPIVTKPTTAKKSNKTSKKKK